MSNFSFSHSVFKNLISQGLQKVSLCGNGLKEILKQTFTTPYQLLTHLMKKAFENIVGKGKGIDSQNFHIFHNVFFSYKRHILHFELYCTLSANAFSLDQAKTVNRETSYCNLTLYHTIQTFNDPKIGFGNVLIFPQCFLLCHKGKLSF